MSVVFVVTPLIVGGWPVIAAAATASAAAMGLKLLQKGQAAAKAVARNEVTLDVDNVEQISGGMKDDERLVFGDDRLRITIERDGRGRTTVHADGTLPKKELEAAGQDFVGRMVQQYAYQKVVSELRKSGMEITEESVTADRKVRVRFRSRS